MRRCTVLAAKWVGYFLWKLVNDQPRLFFASAPEEQTGCARMFASCAIVRFASIVRCEPKTRSSEALVRLRTVISILPTSIPHRTSIPQCPFATAEPTALTE